MKIRIWNEPEQKKKACAEGAQQVILAWEGRYENGDMIEYSGLDSDQFYVVRADAAIDEAMVLVKSDTICFRIPFDEKKTSYNPVCFTGERHYVSVRPAEHFEISRYRNLALNPLDQHDANGIFPHAYANVETRGEAVFAARNAIDGMLATGSHGEWPYESWGINRQADAELTLEFGRPVDISCIKLYTRADFPHDSWWTEATVTFSDGTQTKLPMVKKKGEPHSFTISPMKKAIIWLRLGELIKADDPSPFPALTQIEVYGTEHSD